MNPSTWLHQQTVATAGELQPVTAETVTQAYRFALDPTPSQVWALASHCGAARFAYNWGLGLVVQGLDERARAHEAALMQGLSQREAKALAKASISVPRTKPELQRAWNAAKHEAAPWWEDNSKEAYASGFDALARALKNYFDSKAGRRKGNPVGFPRFKKKGRGRRSCRFTTGALRVEADRHHVVLPRMGRIKTHESTRKLARRVEQGSARILSATVSADAAGRWYVSFTCEVKRCLQPPAHAPRLAPKGVAVGVDVGVRDLLVAVTSEGREVLRVAAPRPLGAAQAKLSHLGRKVARQHAGSNRVKRTHRHIGRLHARVTAIRRDAIAKATTVLTQGCDVLVIEDINVSGLGTRKRGLGARGRGFNRALTDASLGEIRRQLSYKARWYGAEVVVADRFWPSSKTCSACGSRKPRLSLTERTFVCESCGFVVDRDFNAAVNLARLGETGSAGKKRPAGSGPVAGRGAGHETEAARAADAAGCEASTRPPTSAVG